MGISFTDARALQPGDLITIDANPNLYEVTEVLIPAAGQVKVLFEHADHIEGLGSYFDQSHLGIISRVEPQPAPDDETQDGDKDEPITEKTDGEKPEDQPGDEETEEDEPGDGESSVDNPEESAAQTGRGRGRPRKS